MQRLIDTRPKSIRPIRWVTIQSCAASLFSEAVPDAEVRLGEMMKGIPKGSGGDRRSENFKTDSGVGFEKPKKQVIEELGFSEKQAERFETLAENKDLVERVKADARESEGFKSSPGVTFEKNNESRRILYRIRKDRIRIHEPLQLYVWFRMVMRFVRGEKEHCYFLTV